MDLETALNPVLSKTVMGAVVISDSGDFLYTFAREDVEVIKIEVLAESLIAMLPQVEDYVDQETRQVYLETDQLVVAGLRVGSHYVLVANDADANLGRLRLNLKKASKNVAVALEDKSS